MSKNLDLNLLRDLASMGLSEKEALVYMELLSGGDMSAITLSKEVGLHRQFVYNALGTLKEQGLVLQLGERSKWRAQHPRKFLALAEEQELRAKKIAEQLGALMQQKAGQEFEVSEGIAAFRARSLDNARRTRPESAIVMITGQWEKYFERAGEAMHTEWERIRIAKKISFRMICPLSFRTSMKQDSQNRALTEYRIFPGLEESLLDTVIYEDFIEFQVYGDPHLTFSVKNPIVAKSQKQFFDALWEKSEKL